MKIEINSNTKKKSLILSIITIVIGALLFTNPEEFVKILSYIIGAIFLIYSIIQFISYYKNKITMSLISSITTLIIGLIFFFLADAIEIAIRYLIGAWLLFAGITKLINTLSYPEKDNYFVTNLIISILIIIIGFYIILVSNLILSTIGIIIMIYGSLEVTNYIFNLFEKKKDNKKNDIKDAIIIDKDKKRKN